MNSRIEQCKNDIKKLQEELKRLEIEELENTYKVGDIFIKGKEYYILSQVGHSMMCLIHIRDGNRWRDPIKVDDVCKITKEEFNKIGASYFKRVSGTLVFFD